MGPWGLESDLKVIFFITVAYETIFIKDHDSGISYTPFPLIRGPFRRIIVYHDVLEKIVKN